MISSMTGFGRCEKVSGTKRVVVELKSVNHRYLDVNIKTSRSITALEPAIREYLKKNIGRGKVDAYVHYEQSADETYTIRYNDKLARAYVENMEAMAKEFGIVNDVTVSSLASYPDVFELVAEERDEKELSEMVLEVVGAACDKLLESRRIEGENLKADLILKAQEMDSMVDAIKERSPDIIAEYKERLTQKISELIENGRIDDSRIAAEVTIYADKICVDEEIVRLYSHVKEMKKTLETGEAVGRKLDFLAQEMNREANTILSKSQDPQIAQLGIELKTLIEKIREQVQNLE